MSYKHLFFLLPLLVMGLFSACSANNKIQQGDQRGDVLKVLEIKHLSLPEIKKYTGDSVKSEYLQFGVTCYKLTYNSVYEGEPIATTALLLLPDDTTITRRLCVYLHGTNMPIDPMTAQQQMPSNYFNNRQTGGEVATCAFPLAANGFSVIMPDYIGYGETKDKEHPFVYYPELHFANIDALRAMCRYLGLTGKQDVFIGGFSLGGGAALSLHYYIQNNYASEFNVISSCCLSGPYNYAGQLEGVLRENATIPATLISWSAYVLNRFDVHRNPDQIFSFTVTDQLSAITNFYGGIWDIFRPYFIQGVLSGEDTEWIAAGERNSFHKGSRWLTSPETPRLIIPHSSCTNAVDISTSATTSHLEKTKTSFFHRISLCILDNILSVPTSGLKSICGNMHMPVIRSVFRRCGISLLPEWNTKALSLTSLTKVPHKPGSNECRFRLDTNSEY